MEREGPGLGGRAGASYLPPSTPTKPRRTLPTRRLSRRKSVREGIAQTRQIWSAGSTLGDAVPKETEEQSALAGPAAPLSARPCHALATRWSVTDLRCSRRDAGRRCSRRHHGNEGAANTDERVHLHSRALQADVLACLLVQGGHEPSRPTKEKTAPGLETLCQPC